MEYKRLTTGTLNGEKISEYARINNRLFELENKIENGTLVELPRIITYVCYYSGLEKYVLQWQANGKIKSKTFWSEKKAYKRLEELKK